jgi:hypothetical protein
MNYALDRMKILRGEVNAQVSFSVLNPKEFQDLARKISNGGQVPSPDRPVLVINADGVEFKSLRMTTELIWCHVVLHTVGVVRDGSHAYFPLIFCARDKEHKAWMKSLLEPRDAEGKSSFYAAILGKKTMKGSSDPVKMNLLAFKAAFEDLQIEEMSGGYEAGFGPETCVRCEEIDARIKRGEY